MPRNRVIYQTEAVYVGPTPSTGAFFSSGNSGVNNIVQLHRIQQANYSFNLPLTDVNQYGQLAAIDRINLDPPTVSLDFKYILTNALNESRLGFTVDGSPSAISGILNGTSDDKCYFIATVPDGNDAAGFSPASQVGAIAIGNGFISNYTIDAAVGAFPTASVKVDGLNIAVYTGAVLQPSPAVSPSDGSLITGYNFTLPQAVSGLSTQVSALRPGDITFSFGNGALGVNASDLKVQKFSLSFDLTREDLKKIGTRFAFAKLIKFPATAKVSIDAFVGDLATGNLSTLLCTPNPVDISATLNLPACPGVQSTPAIIFTLKGARIDGENFTSAIGSNKAITMNFSSQLSGPQDTVHSVSISGILT